jgi:hypothetical protein
VTAGAATLPGVSPKKRKSRPRKTHPQGLSGNPQRRAQQLAERRARGTQAGTDWAVLQELASSLAGGASPAEWWPESHSRILARARALSWPSRLVDLETQAGQIVGDEFYDRLQSPGTGLDPVRWLRVLAEQAGRELRAELGQGSDDWQKLWALLCGLARTAPETIPETRKIAGLLDRRGLELGPARLAGGPELAGEALMACDAYGSRVLLVAPFGYDGGAPDHWYAWDIDWCWIGAVVGAGVFASAADALGEWRNAAGPAASGATLTPCGAGMTAWLLGPALLTGVADLLEGSESRELIREYYRLRRRALDLTESADAGGASAPFDDDQAGDAFLDWFAARHGDVPEAVTESAGIILDEWGPHERPDERLFYACSPHRIEMAAHLIRDGYAPEYAAPALRLLPEWTEWCLEHHELSEDAAARSRQAAGSAVSVVTDDEGPYRRPE